MRARRNSDGELIEVIPTTIPGRYQSGLQEYEASDLDFNIESEKEKAVVEIEGWVARDEDGYISLYQEKPTRSLNSSKTGYWWDDETASHIDLPTTSFPSVTWENSPKKVKLKIEIEE